MTRPCTDNPAPFDRLIDLHTTGNRISREARINATEARQICAGCRFRDACWTENAVEPWVDAMKRAPRKPRDDARLGGGGMTTEADLAEFNNGVRRARYAYALRTGEIPRPARPCLVCGKPTLADSQTHGDCDRRGHAR